MERSTGFKEEEKKKSEEMRKNGIFLLGEKLRRLV